MHVFNHRLNILGKDIGFPGYLNLSKSNAGQALPGSMSKFYTKFSIHPTQTDRGIDASFAYGRKHTAPLIVSKGNLVYVPMETGTATAAFPSGGRHLARYRPGD